jgi:hypothetical protein
MTDDRSLQKLLERFVRQHREFEGEWMEESFTWSPALLRLAQSQPFAQFQWIALRVSTRVRTLGIRPVLQTPFLSLAQLETDGFRIEALPHRQGVSAADPNAGRYWIAELVSMNEAYLREYAHTPPATWHVLDEHLLTRQLPDPPPLPRLL